jgi:hypothetical protein
VFALLALVSFVLAVFRVVLPVDLIALGLAFVAAHLLMGDWPLGRFRRPPNP